MTTTTMERIRVAQKHDVWHVIQSYGRIPYEIWYSLGDDPNFVNERNPAHAHLTTNLGRPGMSLSVWIHDSVPRRFREMVLYHELAEAELIYADEIFNPEAHRRAVELEREYARKFFGEKRLTELLKWQKTNLDGYCEVQS